MSGRTTYLGQYTDEVANEIAEELESKGITWYYKQAGGFTRVLFAGEWGTRLFVDAERIEEAKTIAERIQKRAERRRGT